MEGEKSNQTGIIAYKKFVEDVYWKDTSSINEAMVILAIMVENAKVVESVCEMDLSKPPNKRLPNEFWIRCLIRAVIPGQQDMAKTILNRLARSFVVIGKKIVIMSIQNTDNHLNIFLSFLRNGCIVDEEVFDVIINSDIDPYRKKIFVKGIKKLTYPFHHFYVCN